jgi:hypothetical protein
MANNQPKDYFEHLRAVHFTLVFLCVASFLIALARGKEEISPAREQLDQIWKLVDEWNPKFLQATILATNNLVLPDGLGPIKLRAETKVGKWEFAAKLESQQPVAFVTIGAIKEVQSTDCTIDTTTVAGGGRNLYPRNVGSEVSSPQNLQEFAEIWNSLAQAKLYEPDWEGGAYTINGPDTKGLANPKCAMKELGLEPLSASEEIDAKLVKLWMQCLVPSSVVAIGKVQRGNNSDKCREKGIESTGQGNQGGNQIKVAPQYQLHGKVGEHDLYFPVYVSAEELDGQAMLFLGRGQSWHHGRFQDSFRELSEAAAGSETKRWSDLETQLADDEVRSPAEVFEAFGMKIPANLSLYGALAMILLVQAYLWAQLYEFGRAQQPEVVEESVAWMGIYVSRPSRVLVFASLVLLPVTAVAALGIRAVWKYNVQWHSPAPWSKGLRIDCVLFSAGLIAAGTLATLMYRQILGSNSGRSAGSEPAAPE